jgi:hypothetical protein
MHLLDNINSVEVCTLHHKIQMVWFFSLTCQTLECEADIRDPDCWVRDHQVRHADLSVCSFVRFSHQHVVPSYMRQTI